MDKMLLQKLCDKGNSTRQIAAEINKSQTTVRYWLNKYDLKTIHSLNLPKTTKWCPKCNKTKSIEKFYGGDSDNTKTSGYCKLCNNAETTRRKRAIKMEYVEYKGGECCICGYSKCLAALEFHHLDPGEKDFAIADLKNVKLSEKILKELDKCICVCANCHRELHYFNQNEI